MKTWIRRRKFAITGVVCVVVYLAIVIAGWIVALHFIKKCW